MFATAPLDDEQLPPHVCEDTAFNAQEYLRKNSVLISGESATYSTDDPIEVHNCEGVPNAPCFFKVTGRTTAGRYSHSDYYECAKCFGYHLLAMQAEPKLKRKDQHEVKRHSAKCKPRTKRKRAKRTGYFRGFKQQSRAVKKQKEADEPDSFPDRLPNGYSSDSKSESSGSDSDSSDEHVAVEVDAPIPIPPGGRAPRETVLKVIIQLFNMCNCLTIGTRAHSKAFPS